MEAVWVGALAGAVSGLLASIVGHLLLDVQLVSVHIRDDLHIDRASGQISGRSYVEVSNVRGRPVTIEQVALLTRRGMTTPTGWLTDVPHRLEEGGRMMFTFDRAEQPSPTIAVAMDSIRRVWPRRRRWAVRRRAMLVYGRTRRTSRRGPSERQLARATRVMSAIRTDHERESRDDDSD